MKRSLKATLASLAFVGLMGGVAQSADNPRITMIIYTSPGVNFFDPLLKGANDAAKQLNIDLDIQYANNDQATENNIIQTAIANKVDDTKLGTIQGSNPCRKPDQWPGFSTRQQT